MSKLDLPFCIEYIEHIISGLVEQEKTYRPKDEGDRFTHNFYAYTLETYTSILEHLKGIEDE
ncbi:MAG: hypothetical protein GY861_06660 [bacterium]|nr:hypothetical protein [bacterium]